MAKSVEKKSGSAAAGPKAKSQSAKAAARAAKPVKKAAPKPSNSTENNAAPDTFKLTPGDKWMNLGMIEMRFGIDRSTARKKLKAAGLIAENDNTKTEKKFPLSVITPLFQRDEEKENLTKRKLGAEAELKELAVMEKNGQVIQTAEAKDYYQRLFRGLYEEFAVKMPRRIGSKVQKAKTADDATAIIQREVSNIFDKIREDHTKFLQK